MLKPTEIKELCAKYNLLPSKQYGQHYLISDAPIRKMIEAANLSSDDTVVEIGPGFGVLTLTVAPLVKKVIAFEIEQKLCSYWEEKVLEYPNVEIVWGNVLAKLQTPIAELRVGYKVLANLPYQITSEALRAIFEANPKPEKVIVMVQKEVAERICAKKGDMSLLAVSVQYYGAPKIVAQVSRGCFWPAPKVDSAVIAIDVEGTKNKEQKTIDEAVFFRIAKAGFSHKRKQVWRNLAEGLKLPADEMKRALVEVMGNEKVRAEEISIEEWKKIALLISKFSII